MTLSFKRIFSHSARERTLGTVIKSWMVISNLLCQDFLTNHFDLQKGCFVWRFLAHYWKPFYNLEGLSMSFRTKMTTENMHFLAAIQDSWKSNGKLSLSMSILYIITFFRSYIVLLHASIHVSIHDCLLHFLKMLSWFFFIFQSVVSTAFNPCSWQLVTGCLLGKICWHNPIL